MFFRARSKFYLVAKSSHRRVRHSPHQEPDHNFSAGKYLHSHILQSRPNTQNLSIVKKVPHLQIVKMETTHNELVIL